MIEEARMIKRRFDNIVTYLRHRITNAASESINSKIQWVKYAARSFRSKKNSLPSISIVMPGSYPGYPLKCPNSHRI